MLAGRPGIVGTWPGEADPLTSAQRITRQEGLTALGYDTGGTDGVIGARTREAIRAFQLMHGIAADGFATPGLLTRILNARQLQR